jgi:hypothetical protein
MRQTSHERRLPARHTTNGREAVERRARLDETGTSSSASAARRETPRSRPT